MVPLAFGTQTGGSGDPVGVLAGVVGYKPSIGQFSYAGVKLLARSPIRWVRLRAGAADLALLRAALLGVTADVQGAFETAAYRLL